MTDAPLLPAVVAGEAGYPPEVTLCIPSLNSGNLVTETLDSVLAQTEPRWEALVVDDGSTDNSPALIAEYARRDPRIRLMRRARDPKGACACRNIAVENARGRFVLFLDTDDLMAPFCVEQRLKVMEDDPQLDFAIFPMFVFSGDPRNADRLWNVESGEDDLIRLLRLDPICPGTGTLWRRDSFVRVGMWNEQIGMWQDIELHLRAFAGEYRFVKRLDLDPDVYIRETQASLSRGEYQSREKLESRAFVVRRAVPLLRQAGRSELVPHLRFLCAGVVLGAARSGNLDIARELRKWAERERVLTSGESWRLRFAEFCRASRLDRIPLVRKVRERLAQSFRTQSSLGQVRLVSDRARVDLTAGPS
jgi:glycosyltransferase involved in cell wall biosynthesis